MLSSEVQAMNIPNNFFSILSQPQLSPLTPTSPPLLPPMKLLKQTSSSQERISINGLQKSVHVVVKNAPFLVQIALTSQHFHNQMIDLNDFTFDATLLYDSDGPTEKLVDYVKIKPVDHKPTVNETGDQVTIELRIKVLTSQHENSFFRVKISLLDPNTGMPYQPPLVCYSDPVKVISKPEQVKKKPSASTNVTATVPSSKKRTVNDLLLETISRIEEQQREHQLMIEKLLRASENHQHNKPMQSPMPHMQHLPISPQLQMYEQQQQHLQRQMNVSPYTDSNSVLYQMPNMKQSFPENVLSDASCQSPNAGCPTIYSPNSTSFPLANCTAEEPDFEAAFRKFFKVYTKLNEEEKPIKIRKLIRGSSQREAEKISEFLDLFQTEGFHKSVPVDTVQKNSPCQCSTCPYQSEISELNNFYDQILSFPSQSFQQFE